MSKFDKAIKALKKALDNESCEFMITKGLSGRLPFNEKDITYIQLNNQI